MALQPSCLWHSFFRNCSFIGLPESEGQNTSIFDKSTAAYAGIYCWQGAAGQKWLYSVDWEGLGFAKEMALATTVMGAVAWCFYVFSSCMRYHPAIWFLLSLILLATTVTQALQFQLFSNDLCSDGGCTLGKSSRIGISACVFWFISAIMTCGEYLFRLARMHSIFTIQRVLMPYTDSFCNRYCQGSKRQAKLRGQLKLLPRWFLHFHCIR